MTFSNIGAGCFGLVIGWVTYRTLRRREGVTALSDIAAVIAAVGGGAVTRLFASEDLFGAYSIGLAIGFFAYFIVSLIVYGKEAQKQWMGD